MLDIIEAESKGFSVTFDLIRHKIELKARDRGIGLRVHADSVALAVLKQSSPAGKGG